MLHEFAFYCTVVSRSVNRAARAYTVHTNTSLQSVCLILGIACDTGLCCRVPGVSAAALEDSGYCRYVYYGCALIQIQCLKCSAEAVNHRACDSDYLLIIPLGVQHLRACYVGQILRLAELQGLFHSSVYCLVRGQVCLNRFDVAAEFACTLDSLLYALYEHIPGCYLQSVLCCQNRGSGSDSARCSCHDDSGTRFVGPSLEDNIRFSVIACHSFMFLLTFVLFTLMIRL